MTRNQKLFRGMLFGSLSGFLWLSLATFYNFRPVNLIFINGMVIGFYVGYLRWAVKDIIDIKRRG